MILSGDLFLNDVVHLTIREPEIQTGNVMHPVPPLSLLRRERHVFSLFFHPSSMANVIESA
jgi:hypothetical protein